MSYGFYFDQTACIGCRACQIACKDKNDLPVGPRFRMVNTYECGSFPKPGYYHLSATCNHCDNPMCLASCPQGAYSKDEATGAVVHDDEKCIGCQTCVTACPYSVPQFFEADNLVRKCDMCADLVAAGEMPACADCCPMRALEWGDVEELKAAHPNAVNAIAAWPDGGTGPNCLITAKPEANEAGFARKLI